MLIHLDINAGFGFESTLESELGKSKYVSLDDKVANIHMDHLNAKTYIDNASYSYRLDGSNGREGRM